MHWIAWPCLPPPDARSASSAGAVSAVVPGLPGTEAWWALRFTPRVARVDEALLLEVSTTERLWGGRAALLAQLHANAPPWGDTPSGDTLGADVAWQAARAGPKVGGAQAASMPCAALSAAPLATPFTTPFAEGPTAFQALALLRLQLAAEAGAVGGQRTAPHAHPARHAMPRRVPHDLPLHTLTALRPHVASLARMGCNTWGQLRALPRDGVARRLGAAALRALDCAYGDAPHQHTWLELPEVFALTAELPALATSADALLWSAHALLQALQAWLQARQQGVLALELAWHHDLRKVDGKPVPPWQALPVRTAQPTQALAHLRRLLAEHLARTLLAAPVNQIALRALETAPMPHASASLLPPTGRDGRSAQDDARSESWHQWVERLSARLGPEQVQCVALVADHRPECMQRWQPASQALALGGAVAGSQGQGGGLPASGPCALQAPDASLWPTWLLRPPQRLTVQGSRPCYQGPLRLLAGPHRLEAAWWESALSDPTADRADGPDAAGNATPSHGPAPGLVVRDYFVAHNERAGHVWVYRERLSQTAPSAQAPTDAGMPTRQDRWFLHGIYG
ncbi:protein ImuB [Acidovorax sp. 56]|uniref:DNA polymerase Y family protein n=1 Tax=Acidovorax sp. 56 TaxID=2035205 RepID=UPI000C4B414C|nr:DNA polymerase Y family protein [Acidovorax sp. 56]PIF26046.1 protein ImuB [Acidovorax sp. 56]